MWDWPLNNIKIIANINLGYKIVNADVQNTENNGFEGYQFIGMNRFIS